MLPLHPVAALHAARFLSLTYTAVLGAVICLPCVTALAGGGEVLVYEQLGMTASRKKLAPMLQVQQNLGTDMFQCPRELRTLTVKVCMLSLIHI